MLKDLAVPLVLVGQLKSALLELANVADTKQLLADSLPPLQQLLEG